MKKTIAIMLAFVCVFSSATAIRASEDNAIENATSEEVTIKISAAGDCTLGSDLSYGYANSFMNVFDNLNSYSYFFENVKYIFDNDDLTIVNLEGTLTTSTDKQDKQFTFKGNPEFVNILKEGSIEAVNLANNHCFDYGWSGYAETKSVLEDNDITYFDANGTAIYETKGVKIGLVGLYVTGDSSNNRSLIQNQIESVKNRGASIVIISFHWGVETNTYPEEYQQTLGKLAIDSGADLVLGHHPHVLQGIEQYNGKYIVYSLGNFCFGGNKNPKDKDTMIFTQEFTLVDGELVDSEATVIPASISSVSSKNDYKPTVAEGDEKERIYKKLSKLSLSLNNNVDIIEGMKLADTVEEEPVMTVETVEEEQFEENIKVVFQGNELEFDLPIINKDGRVYYPFRQLLEAMGAEVDWDDDTGTAIGTLVVEEEQTQVYFTIGESSYRVLTNEQEETVYMDEGVAPFIKYDRTYIPIRYVAEGLGFVVSWDEATGTISID